MGKQSPCQPGVQSCSDPRHHPWSRDLGLPCSQLCPVPGARPDTQWVFNKHVLKRCRQRQHGLPSPWAAGPLHCLHSSYSAKGAWTHRHLQLCQCAQRCLAFTGGEEERCTHRPLAWVHGGTRGSTSATGLLKRELRKCQQGTQKVPKASAHEGGEEESLNEGNGDLSQVTPSRPPRKRP